MSDWIAIGTYQLANLQSQNVRFLFINLGEEPFSHALLAGSLAMKSDDLFKYIEVNELAADHPIVLICDDGKASIAVAERLAQKDFKNVFIIDGGFQSLN